MRRFPANPFAQPSAPSRGGVPPSRASPPAPLGWRGPPLGACQISFFLAPTWTGEGEGSGLFDAAPRLRFAPCPRPLPFPASGPTGARPLAPFTYGICTRTEQGKKNTGQEQEQKQQNTPFPAVFYNHGCRTVAGKALKRRLSPQNGKPSGRRACQGAHRRKERIEGVWLLPVGCRSERVIG